MSELLVTGRTFNLGPVTFSNVGLRLADPRLQATVVGQQQQALAVEVEAAGRLYARRIDVVRQCGASLGICELTQHLVWLVYKNQHYL